MNLIADEAVHRTQDGCHRASNPGCKNTSAILLSGILSVNALSGSIARLVDGVAVAAALAVVSGVAVRFRAVAVRAARAALARFAAHFLHYRDI